MFMEEKRMGEPQEPPSLAKFLLIRAERRLSDPAVEWVKHGPLYGEPQDCLETAISRVAEYAATPSAMRAMAAVRHVICQRTGCYKAVPEWNDHPMTTFSDVMSVLAEAIEIVDTEFPDHGQDFCNFISPPVALFRVEYQTKIAAAMIQQGGKYDAANDAWYLPTGMSAPVMVPASYFSHPVSAYA